MNGSMEMGDESDGSAASPEQFGIGRLFWRIPEAVIVTDAVGRIVLWNPAAARIFGYGAAEVLGRSRDLIVPDGLQAAHRAGLARFTATGHGPLIDAGAPVQLPACTNGEVPRPGLRGPMNAAE